MKSIIFYQDLMPGVLAGLVTETRRVLKPQPDGEFLDFDGQIARFLTEAGENTCKPRFVPGDRVRVKEAWATFPEYDYLKPSEIGRDVKILYRAIDDGTPFVNRWRSPLFMPRWMSRAVIVITGVSIQHVQDITKGQAIASGITPHDPNPVKQYRDLWDRLNAGRGFGWGTRPWCWVYKFKLEQNKGEKL